MDTRTETVELVGDETTRNLARAVLFAAITGATAPMSVTHPLAPNVPITLQTLWVYLAGVVLGPVWAGLAFALYLLAGLVGLPVFQGGGGLGYLLGPTGGFLVGFVAAAVVVGFVVHGRGDLVDPSEVGLPRLLAALVAGTAVVYVFGAVGLTLTQAMSAPAALALVVTFLPTDAVKVAATIAIVRSEAIVAR